jgi:hypothetical protein
MLANNQTTVEVIPSSTPVAAASKPEVMGVKIDDLDL